MTKTDAAKELLALYNSMEVRKIKLSTMLRKMHRLNNGNWHVCGHGYDYTV